MPLRKDKNALEVKLETLEEPQDEIAKLTKEIDLARARQKILKGKRANLVLIMRNL